MQICRGAGRKLSVPFLVLSLLGWILNVIGFAALNNTNNYFTGFQNSECGNLSGGFRVFEEPSIPSQRASLLWFPHWCVLIIGPFVYITTVIHLIIGRYFTGIFAKCLTAMYIATGGATVYDWCVRLFNTNYSWDALTSQNCGLWAFLELVGAFDAIFFLTIFMMMWPLFGGRYMEYYEEEEVYEDEEDKDQLIEEQAV